MEKTYITIESIDNGWLVEAHETDPEGYTEDIKFAVKSDGELVDAIVAAFLD